MYKIMCEEGKHEKILCENEMCNKLMNLRIYGVSGFRDEIRCDYLSREWK